MKATFGLLLIGGGILIMYGLFSGKIVFPLGSGASSSSSAPQTGTSSGSGGS